MRLSSEAATKERATNDTQAVAPEILTRNKVFQQTKREQQSVLQRQRQPHERLVCTDQALHWAQFGPEIPDFGMIKRKEAGPDKGIVDNTGD